MITPIMANGIVAQTQNVNVLNHGEESKAQIVNQNGQISVEAQREEAHSTVVVSQSSDRTDTRHDAKEEGKNKYFSNRGESKKKKPDSFGAVVKKKNGGGFDISI